MTLLHLTDEHFDERYRAHLGVVTVPTAPARWVVQVLRRLARDEVASANRGLEALLQRLWARLNSALVRSGRDDAVEREIVAEPMPVWTGKRLVAVDLRGIPALYVDDDPFASRFIKGFERAVHLRPSRAETEWTALSAALARQLGADKVLHTSKVEPEVTFEPKGEPMLLLEWLERATRVRRRLRTDIAVLLRHESRSSATDDRARAAYRRFLEARVQFGELSATGYDSYWRRSQRLLQVSDAIKSSPARVFAESWPVVGEDWRATWMDFGRELGRDAGAVERFFRERRIGEEARDEVRLEFGLDVERLQWLQPGLYALWSRGRSGASRDEFERELAQRPSEEWAAWLDCEALHSLVTREEAGERPESWVPACGIGWSEWHAARKALGLPIHRFRESSEAFRRGLEHLMAVGLTMAASGAALDPEALMSLPSTKPPPDLVLAPPDHALLARAWTSVVTAQPWSSKVVEALVAVITAGQDIAATVPPVCDADVVVEYRDHTATERAKRATDMWSALDEVVDALARHRATEPVANGWADEAVKAARDGSLANAVLLRDRAGAALRAVAPRAAAVLAGAGLLGPGKGPIDLRMYAQRLAPTPAPARRPTREVEIAGVKLAPAVKDGANVDAADTAKLMEALAASLVAPQEMDALVASAARRAPVGRERSERGSGGSAGGGGTRGGTWRPAEESEASKRTTGLGGELFVFQQFRAWLPGFDEHCWKSSARVQLGIGEVGDDGLGYDFAYLDTLGRLCGRPGARCLIEVKASKGPADATFPMTRNEWRIARDAHASDGDAYVIVRVEEVGKKPRVCDILLDPFDMLEQGLLDWREKDIWITVAPVRTPHGNGGEGTPEAATGEDTTLEPSGA